jgi:hypothetical protein
MLIGLESPSNGSVHLESSLGLSPDGVLLDLTVLLKVASLNECVGAGGGVAVLALGADGGGVTRVRASHGVEADVQGAAVLEP